MQDIIANLDPQWREYFEERAAILEFEAKLPRDEAEALALHELRGAMKVYMHKRQQIVLNQ